MLERNKKFIWYPAILHLNPTLRQKLDQTFLNPLILLTISLIKLIFGQIRTCQGVRGTEEQC